MACAMGYSEECQSSGLVCGGQDRIFTTALGSVDDHYTVFMIDIDSAHESRSVGPKEASGTK